MRNWESCNDRWEVTVQSRALWATSIFKYLLYFHKSDVDLTNAWVLGLWKWAQQNWMDKINGPLFWRHPRATGRSSRSRMRSSTELCCWTSVWRLARRSDKNRWNSSWRRMETFTWSARRFVFHAGVEVTPHRVHYPGLFGCLSGQLAASRGC